MPNVENPKLGDIDVIFLILNDNKTKQLQCHLLPLKVRAQNVLGKKIYAVAGF